MMTAAGDANLKELIWNATSIEGIGLTAVQFRISMSIDLAHFQESYRKTGKVQF
jgi:hypothetical protein